MVRFFTLLGIFVLASCTKDLTTRKEVYLNDFERHNVRKLTISNPQGNIDPNQVTYFNNNAVLGPFNTHYVQLELNSLPSHNRLKIEFDLYIHDNWRGNQILPGNTNPDLWILEVDQQYPLVTTFANLRGQYQSFPLHYTPGVNPFPAGGNAWEINLPGRCALVDKKDGTSLYKVDLFHFHTGGMARIAFTDKMQEPYLVCDRSWSIDNIRVTAMEFF